MKVGFEKIKESRGWLYRQGKISLFQDIREEKKGLNINLKKKKMVN